MELFAFAHIPKTAGTTVQLLLRRYFGLGHLDLPRGASYSPQRLSRELRLNPFIKSVASHAMRPYVDFAPLGRPVVWYTFLREPVARYRSHYQHVVERHGFAGGLGQWLEDDSHWNWQVRMLGGGPDLDAAKATLRDKIRCLGLTERFHEALLLMRERLGWKGFRVAYGRPRNTAKVDSMRQRVIEEFEQHQEAVQERNSLDIELYRFARDEIYPAQVADYGAERLREDVEREFSLTRQTIGEHCRYWQSVAFRQLIYRPVAKLAGWAPPQPERPLP